MNTEPSILHTRIQAALTHLDLAHVLLFGSYAKNTVQEDSDLDIIVVLDDTRAHLPFSERVRWIRQVRQCLESCGLLIGMDILVYTLPQWEKFLVSNSSFVRELHESAIKIA
ncbi:MAG: nucleotidyltransferase domain-containing protein [Verrucomicrobia bacterium]|nr:nucleotidyltransferase domain-containing protein [Verrucomicrobiota bacterium]